MAEATIKRTGSTLDTLDLTAANFATEETSVLSKNALVELLSAFKKVSGLTAIEEAAQLGYTTKIFGTLKEMVGASDKKEKEEKQIRKGILNPSSGKSGVTKDISQSVGILFSSAGPAEKLFTI